MTAWAEEVARHAGHLLRFRDDTRLDCRECARPILLPLRPDLAPTPTPPPFQINTENVATPEQIACRKREALAALAMVRQKRTTKEET